MIRAQIEGSGYHDICQWPQDCGRIRIDIGERGHSRQAAGGPGTTTHHRSLPLPKTRVVACHAAATATTEECMGPSPCLIPTTAKLFRCMPQTGSSTSTNA